MTLGEYVMYLQEHLEAYPQDAHKQLEGILKERGGVSLSKLTWTYKLLIREPMDERTTIEFVL